MPPCPLARRTAPPWPGWLCRWPITKITPRQNRCWAGDIIYIRTTAGWRNLAVLIDLFSRRVVGWKLDHRMDAALVVEALNRALGHRRVEPEMLLVHPDQGSQYRASDYRVLLGKHEIVCSMSAKGCCLDNAVVESFLSTLKLELDLDDNREVLIPPPSGKLSPVLLTTRGLKEMTSAALQRGCQS